jgi:hypothetical protein
MTGMHSKAMLPLKVKMIGRIIIYKYMGLKYYIFVGAFLFKSD